MSEYPSYDGPPPDNVVQGIAPPHSIESEQGVLGAVLLSDRAMYSYVVESQLKPDDFYRERHRVIFGAMVELYRESEPIDVLTVTEHLRARAQLDAAGGQAGIDELTAAVPAVGNIKRYGEIVKEMSLMRRLLQATYAIQASVHGRESLPKEIVEQAERAMLEVAHDDSAKAFSTAGTVIEHEIEIWHKLSTDGVAMTGTPSGFTDLDTITGGFQPGNLIILAARPSMGKSALVTNIAENVALHPEKPMPVALFSLEMSEGELAQRFVASQASIEGDDLRKGRLKDERKWKKVLEAASRYDVAPLYIDDSSDIGVLEIRAKARRLHQQMQPDYGGLGLIIIDYLQLMRPDGRTDNRVEQVGQMSRGLKILARELGVPVIALSQLSRGVESRTDKRPMLSDLRECVTGDTLVVLADGRRVPIAELVGTRPEVVAVDERHRLVTAESDRVWPVGQREVLRVRLEGGRTLRATAEHRILTDAGWATVGGCSAGDRVGVAIDDRRPSRSDVRPLRGVGSERADDGCASTLTLTRSAADAGDLFWDRVVAVEPAGVEEVYDLTVPGPACWLADGIVSHNSGAIEQDADLAMFIYRDEYYFPDTTENPGEGELIIAKHRNGSLGTVNLVFQGKYTRFRNMTREYD
ncbi:MAG: dnaB [Solirubrobacterales bacterium]|nr:dnaB [Solirubrobacterales bacterium]